MRGWDAESARSAAELNQLVSEWCHSLDANGGLGMAELLTADCHYTVGGSALRGHAAIENFYTQRAERVRTQQKDGVRTQRHTFSNLRVSFDGAARAALGFTIVNYSGEGKPPASGLGGPTIVADCHMHCRREADGVWRIAEFGSEPVLVGNDPFLNASVLKR